MERLDEFGAQLYVGQFAPVHSSGGRTPSVIVAYQLHMLRSGQCCLRCTRSIFVQSLFTLVSISSRDLCEKYGFATSARDKLSAIFEYFRLSVL